MPHAEPEIAVIIPCHNEEVAIGAVIDSFRAALPNATIFAYDNCSTDATSRVAREHGAVVRYEPQKGKGNVVRRMFADVEADIYVMVDGDDTYDASAAPELIRVLLTESVDMVTGIREHDSDDAYRTGHRFGNWLLTALVAYIFGNRSRDMLSGYRVMSRRFIKSFPSLSAGFEIETEITVHALELAMAARDASGLDTGDLERDHLAIQQRDHPANRSNEARPALRGPIHRLRPLGREDCGGDRLRENIQAPAAWGQATEFVVIGGFG